MLWFFFLFTRVFVACLCLAIPLMLPQASLWVYVLFWPTAVAILMLGLLDPRYLLRRTIATIATSAIAGFVISGVPALTEDAIANDTLREVLNLVIAMVTGRMTQDNGWPLVLLVSVTLLVLAGLEGMRMWEERPKDARFVARRSGSRSTTPERRPARSTRRMCGFGFAGSGLSLRRLASNRTTACYLCAPPYHWNLPRPARCICRRRCAAGS